MVKHVVGRLRDEYVIALPGVVIDENEEPVGNTYRLRRRSILRLLRAVDGDTEQAGEILGLIRADPNVFTDGGQAPEQGLEDGLADIVAFLGTTKDGVEAVRGRFFERPYARDAPLDKVQEYD